MEMTTKNAAYIGDGVYVGYEKDLNRIWLHANSHDEPTDRVCLEPEVFRALIEFAKRVGMIKE